MTQKTLSLDALNLRKANDEPFEMPYLLPDGSKSGVTILVLGAHSETVQNGVARLLNERRRKEAQAIGKSGKAVDFTPVEDDIEFGQRGAAIRISGWRGITEECTPDLALKLCRINPDLASQVMEASNDAGHFTKMSS